MKSRAIILIALLSVLMIGVLAVKLMYDRRRVHYLTIATGAEGGEYYAFARALEDVIGQTYDPKIRLRVEVTDGAIENMRRLERGAVALGIVQSDLPAGPSVRGIASLFPEVFHLIVRKDAGVMRIPDLRGKRIALMPEGSGANEVFRKLSAHYDLRDGAFEEILKLPPAAAYKALLDGRVDVVCQMIAPGNPLIREVLHTGEATLAPVDQVEAVRLYSPLLEAITIPKGAYNADPAVPSDNLPTVSVKAMLMTHKGADKRLIHQVTRVLYDERNKLVTRNPRAATIRLPASGEDLGIPLHSGAKAYYDRDKPSFLVTYAETMGFVVSVAVLIASSIWQLRLRLQQRQKNRADMYNLQILGLVNQVRAAVDLDRLEEIRTQLFEIFDRVIKDLDTDQISLESFQSFTFPWEAAISTIRHREMMLSDQ